jgi:hypothetical protein
MTITEWMELGYSAEESKDLVKQSELEIKYTENAMYTWLTHNEF